MQPRQLARIGMTYLEGAVLGVLFELKKKGEERDLTAISQELDLPLRQYTYGSNHNEILLAILHRLEDEGRVECYSADNKKWQLTAEEFRDWQ